jgi:hypothetical protein
VGARFFVLFQTGHGTHPAFYTVGTGSFPGVKRPGRGVDHPPHLALKLKNEWSCIYLLPLWAFVACYRVNIIGILIKVVIFHILNLKLLKPTFGLVVKGL